VRYLFLLLLPLICACGDEYASVPTSTGSEWEITGIVFDGETGQPIAGQSVEMVRLERDCRWCKMRGIHFVSTATDSAGHFVVRSSVMGVYGLSAVSSDNSFCVASMSLGHLKSQKKRAELRIPHKDCVPRL
jgi:hypothetical protein